MAWRIEAYLIKGEVDNRVRGRVTGRLWFTGREEPVVLDLEGNAWRDLAGHVLRFTNPAPKPARAGEWDHFPAQQRGVVGDITASRKVKVPDCPMDEVMEYIKARKPFPWHWGNSLYLEWHGERNGRVVIESADYTLELDAETAWTMDEAEERTQREANGRAMMAFMERLGRAMENAADSNAGAAELPAEDDDAPTSKEEAKADAEAARMDLLLDRVTARMEREGLEPEELERVMAEERARLRKERGEAEPKPPTPEEEAERAERIADMNAAGEEALAEMETEKWKGDDFDDEDEHPLLVRIGDLTCRLMKEVKARGWLTDAEPREHPLRELVDGVMIANGKLAGALGPLDEDGWPPDKLIAGSVLVRLKKARGHLRDARAGLDAADEQGLAEAGWRTEIRKEVTGLLEEVERLIAEVRAILADE